MDLVNTQDNSLTQLFAGEFPRVSKDITIVLGAGLLVLGTLLGKITKGAVTKAAKTGDNTGDGTLTLDSTTPKLAGSKAGVYTVRIIRAAIAAVGTTPEVAAQLALAELKDPDGNVLETFEVAGSSGTAIANQVKFVIVEGAGTPFAKGDGFDITIAAGSGSYNAYDADAVDGTEIPVAILAEDADDATSAAVKSVAYVAGHFNSAALTGYDANAGTLFEGSPIFIGSAV